MMASRWGGEAQKNQESINWIKNLERTKEENLSGGDICFDQLVGGDYCFDIEGFMGYLDSDQESSKKMNLEASGVGVGNHLEERSRTLTKQNFSAVGDCSAPNQCEIGGFRFDDLCSDDFDISWLVRCLDSDKQVLEEFGGGLCLDDLSGGDICFNDLVGEDLSSVDFDIEWFMRCLDSDKQVDPFEDNSISKVVKRKVMIGFTELGGGLCLDDLHGGDLYFDEVSEFDIDWLMQILDSNQEEQQLQDTKLGKRKFESEKNSKLTKKMRF